MLLKRECQTITIIEPYGGKKAISIKKQIGKKQRKFPFLLVFNLYWIFLWSSDIKANFCYSYQDFPTNLRLVSPWRNMNGVRRSSMFMAVGNTNGEVIIYELPSNPHDICSRAIADEIMEGCRNARRTAAQIGSFWSARKHWFMILFALYLYYTIDYC